MDERRVLLAVRTIVRIIHPLQLDPSLPKWFLVQKCSTRRTREVNGATHLLHQSDEPLLPRSTNADFACLPEWRLNTQALAGNVADQVLVEFREVFPGAMQVEILKEWAVEFEVRRGSVILMQLIPVALLPVTMDRLHLIDPPVEVAWSARDCHPIAAARRLDEVAVAPVVLGVLGIIVEQEQVDTPNEIEKALPGKVIGLKDSDALHGCSISILPERYPEFSVCSGGYVN